MLPRSRVSLGLSLSGLASERARALAGALGLQQRGDELAALVERVMQPWGNVPLAPHPEWPSQVVDDGTPFELSVALEREPEVRMLFEPLGSPPSLASNIAAARDLLESLAREHAIDLSRFERIAELFLPEKPHGRFGIWMAVGLRAEGPPDFKLYLNPQASGIREAPLVVGEALHRLGFDRAWPVVGKVLTRRGPVVDELKYFSLDLSPSPEARIKVYARHHASTVDDLVAAAAGCPSYRPDLIRRFLATASPDRAAFQGRGPFTCYAFVQGQPLPASVTTHFPINGYAPNDEVASRRVRSCLALFQLPVRPYERALGVIATRPLHQGIGLNSYVSFRYHRGEPRITLYLPREAYAPGTVEDPSRRASGVTERAIFPALDIARHPFTARMLRDPDLTPLLCLLRSSTVALNLLGGDVAPVSDPPPLAETGLYELFVKAPNESCAEQMEWLAGVVEALGVERPLAPRLLEAGQRLHDQLAIQRRSKNPHRRIGAAFARSLLATEICSVTGQRLAGHPEMPRLPTLRAAPIWSLDGALPEDAYVRIIESVAECASSVRALLDELYDVSYCTA